MLSKTTKTDAILSMFVLMVITTIAESGVLTGYVGSTGPVHYYPPDAALAGVTMAQSTHNFFRCPQVDSLSAIPLFTTDSTPEEYNIAIYEFTGEEEPGMASTFTGNTYHSSSSGSNTLSILQADTMYYVRADVALQLQCGQSLRIVPPVRSSSSSSGGSGASSVATTCGNGVIDIGEECDDGYSISGDGCDATCVIEPGYQCNGEPSACIPINPNLPGCGNGICEEGEDAQSCGCTTDGDCFCAMACEKDCESSSSSLSDAFYEVISSSSTSSQNSSSSDWNYSYASLPHYNGSNVLRSVYTIPQDSAFKLGNPLAQTLAEDVIPTFISQFDAADEYGYPASRYIFGIDKDATKCTMVVTGGQWSVYRTSELEDKGMIFGVPPTGSMSNITRTRTVFNTSSFGVPNRNGLRYVLVGNLYWDPAAPPNPYIDQFFCEGPDIIPDHWLRCPPEHQCLASGADACVIAEPSTVVCPPDYDTFCDPQYSCGINICEGQCCRCEPSQTANATSSVAAKQKYVRPTAMEINEGPWTDISITADAVSAQAPLNSPSTISMRFDDIPEDISRITGAELRISYSAVPSNVPNWKKYSSSHPHGFTVKVFNFPISMTDPAAWEGSSFIFRLTPTVGQKDNYTRLSLRGIATVNAPDGVLATGVLSLGYALNYSSSDPEEYYPFTIKDVRLVLTTQ